MGNVDVAGHDTRLLLGRRIVRSMLHFGGNVRQEPEGDDFTPSQRKGLRFGISGYPARVQSLSFEAGEDRLNHGSAEEWNGYVDSAENATSHHTFRRELNRGFVRVLRCVSVTTRRCLIPDATLEDSASKILRACSLGPQCQSTHWISRPGHSPVVLKGWIVQVGSEIAGPGASIIHKKRKCLACGNACG